MAEKRKRLVAAGLLFLTASALTAQSRTASVDITPNEPVAGDRIRITFSFPVSYSIDSRFVSPKPLFPRGVTLLSGPHTRILPSRTEGDRVEYSYVVEIGTAGEYEFGTFKLEAPQGTVYAKPFILTVKEARNINERVTPELSWREIPETVYQGQSFTLVLEGRNLTDLISPDSVVLPPISGVLIEDAGGFGGINEYTMDDTLYYSIPIGAWVITPERQRPLIIPAMRVRLGNSVQYISAQSISVEAPPKEIAGSGAIGSFRFFVTPPPNEELEEGKVISITMRLEGEGNFQLLQLPELHIQNFDIIDQQESERLVPSSGGYSGFREVTYRLKARSSHAARFIIPSFNWLDLKSDTVISSGQKLYTFKVTPINETSFFQFLSPTQILAMRDFNIAYYLWPFVLIALFIFLQFIKRRRPKEPPLKFFGLLPLFTLAFTLLPLRTAGTPEALFEAERAIANEEWHEAIAYYALAAAELPMHRAALTYNQALCYQRLGEKGWVVFFLHKALQYNPFSKRYAETLHAFEKKEQLNSNIAVDARQIWVMPFMAAISLFCSVFALILKSKVYWRVLLLNITLVAGLGAGGYLAYIAIPRYNRVVVIEDKNLYKIPDPASSLSSIAKAGTSFTVSTRYHNYLLLHGAVNTEGWATTENLMFLNRNKNE
jgi:tetratricopeptide (TPR) repeat protein